MAIGAEYVKRIYSVYCRYCNSKDEKDFSSLKSQCSGLVELIVDSALQNISTQYKDVLKRRLYPYTYTLLLDALKPGELLFSDPFHFQAYISASISGFVFHEFLRRSFSHSIIPYADIEDIEEWSKHNFSGLADDPDLTEKMKNFLEFRVDREEIEFVCRGKFRGQTMTAQVIRMRFRVGKWAAQRAVEMGDFLYRCMVFSCFQRTYSMFSPKVYENDMAKIDKLYLLLVIIGRDYPLLPELYHALGGEALYRLISLVGGETVRIPPASVWKRIMRELDILEEFTDNPTAETRSRLCKQYDLNKKDFVEILDRNYLKFENIPSFNDKFQGITNLYARCSQR